jgi:RHH-type rel operon transcriptional repressor/antitoxin RelB
MFTSTSVRLSEETEKRLSHLALETGRTKAFYIRKIIEDHLEDMEDYYLAAETLANVRKGEEKVTGWDEVVSDLGLDN